MINFDKLVKKYPHILKKKEILLRLSYDMLFYILDHEDMRKDTISIFDIYEVLYHKCNTEDGFFIKNKDKLISLGIIIPERLFTQELANEYCEKDIRNINNIPTKFITKEMCDKAMNNEIKLSICDKKINKYIIKKGCISLIKLTLKMKYKFNSIDQEIADNLFDLNHMNFTMLPNKYITKRMAEAIKKDGLVEYYKIIPDEYKDDEMKEDEDIYFDICFTGCSKKEISNEEFFKD